MPPHTLHIETIGILRGILLYNPEHGELFLVHENHPELADCMYWRPPGHPVWHYVGHATPTQQMEIRSRKIDFLIPPTPRAN